jgi:hypothetical protein
MSFSLELTADQIALRDKAHAFARDVIRPVAAEYDRAQEFPWPVLDEAAREGLYGWELYAQLSTDPTGLSLPILMEELFWGCSGIGLSIVMPALALAAIRQAATNEQLARWAPECFGSPGAIKLAALAVTEPSGGSDIRSIQTQARRDGDDWVIDGHKVFIGNGGIADVHVVVATVDPEAGHRAQGNARPLDAAQTGQARLPRLAHRRDPPDRLPRARRSSVGRPPATRGANRQRPRIRARAQAHRPSGGGRAGGSRAAPQLGSPGGI